MNKKLSFLSLSLLLVPAHFFAMEETPTDRRELAKQVEEGLVLPKDMVATVAESVESIAQPIPQMLTKSTIATRTKAMENSPAFEEKPSAIWGMVNYFSDPTSNAIYEVNNASGKGTGSAHKIEWGIEDTLKKIHCIREYNKPQLASLPKIKGDYPTTEEAQLAHTIAEENRRKTADSLLTILRAEREHNKNLKTIIAGANKKGIKINEDVLAKAHTHLEKARQEALQYQLEALKETQEYLQEDKALRSYIYGVKLVKHELTEPSDDEYDDESICNHYLNVASSTGFLEFK